MKGFLILLTILLSGCVFLNKKPDGEDKSAYIGRQAPSDVSQTEKITVYGLYIFPDGVALGYVNSYQTTTPGYDIGTYVPDTSIEEVMDSTGKVATRYSIGQLNGANVIMEEHP